MSPRIRRVLKLVEELELDGAELTELRAELDARKGCEIDVEACADPADLALAKTIKRRIDAAARGDTTMVTMAEADGILRDRQKARRWCARWWHAGIVSIRTRCSPAAGPCSSHGRPHRRKPLALEVLREARPASPLRQLRPSAPDKPKLAGMRLTPDLPPIRWTV